MKFMLMMNAPRGTGDWQVMNWPPEDLKAHIGFMMRFHQELKDEGVLVGAEGLASPAWSFSHPSTPTRAWPTTTVSRPFARTCTKRRETARLPSRTTGPRRRGRRAFRSGTI